MRDSDSGSNLFKDRLSVIRMHRGWNQPELAERAGTHESSIAHYENGSRMPSCEALVRLADCLEVSTDYLLGRVDRPELPQIRDPLFQNLAKISHADRLLALNILKLLSDRK
jgi:transcriptional regulator with XRE-family HTH domain